MKEQFVSYEIALKLKKLGFDESCFAYYKPYYEKDVEGKDVITYPMLCSFMQTIDEELKTFKYSELDSDSWDDYLLAPLWQQVIDWFREVKNINVEVWYDNTQDDGFPWLYEIYIDNKEHQHDGSYYDSFYEVREQAILKAFELIKK